MHIKGYAAIVRIEGSIEGLLAVVSLQELAEIVIGDHHINSYAR